MDKLVTRVRALLRRPAYYLSVAPGQGNLQLPPGQCMPHCDEECSSLAASEMQIMLPPVRKDSGKARPSALEAIALGLTETVMPNAIDLARHRMPADFARHCFLPKDRQRKKPGPCAS